jgi:hypothetical protein
MKKLLLTLTLLALACAPALAQRGSRGGSSYRGSSTSSRTSTYRTYTPRTYTPRVYSPRTYSTRSYPTYTPRTYSYHPRTYTPTYSGVQRDSRGRIKRSTTAKNEFKRTHPCPATGQSSGPCRGYVIDHIHPLATGGADAPSNMQWQTKEAAKAKDRWERKQ